MSNEIDDIIINRKTKPISQKLNPCHANNLQASGLNDDYNSPKKLDHFVSWFKV